MTSSNNVSSPFESANAIPSIRLPKIRDNQSMASSISSLPYRVSNASVSSLFASTSTHAGSRSVSPSGAGTPTGMKSSSVFGGTPGGTPGEGNIFAPAERATDPRNLILQAFVPHIAVHTSDDTHELMKEKGFDGGLWEVLRPFGERVQGKVNVRDSIGSGKIYEDYAVRFVQLGDGLEGPDVTRRSGEGRATSGRPPVSARRVRTGGDVGQIESLVDRHLTHAEEYPAMDGEDYLTFKDKDARDPEAQSPFYTLYLRRLLSGIPMEPHETFSHPVACIIAISSRNKDPIQALRKLYDESSNGEKRLPLWVSNEYLRYYVLVHDEEQDDITKSITLFEQMKRHFGLHCHLLRLRSSQCVLSDDDSILLPRCEWVSASEELIDIQNRENQEDVGEPLPCIYESDTTAIKTFIREMVTQSVIPSMERCVSTWNDQVASRRRGIGGRFMSLSKKWAFGSTSRASSNGNTPASNSNYDAVQGFYRPDTAEAIMRKLADYAFMLRDWKLAQSTYELLRSDFNNDKAWRYHAAANEMAAISTLLIPQALSSKVRSETVDQMLETAAYSYITRCGASYGALRGLALGMELLRLRGGSATDDAARWGTRLLDHKVVGVVGDALMKERIAACYASKIGFGSGLWGSRTRKSALWSILAADSWLTLSKPQQAKSRLDEAGQKYTELKFKEGLEHFEHANEFLSALRREVNLALYPESALDGSLVPDVETEVSEAQDFVVKSHRKSLMSAQVSIGGLESSPLHGGLSEPEEEQVQFE